MKSHESLSQCRLWRQRRSDCPLRRCWGSWLEQNGPLICLLVFWKKGNQKKTPRVIKTNNLTEILLNSVFLPRKVWVPHAYEPVQASSDQQAVLLTQVKCLDTFVDDENPLVAWCPGLWRPAQLDLLGLTFVAGLSDLTQLLLSVC